jgi:hypothetical protein
LAIPVFMLALATVVATRDGNGAPLVNFDGELRSIAAC